MNALSERGSFATCDIVSLTASDVFSKCRNVGSERVKARALSVWINNSADALWDVCIICD